MLETYYKTILFSFILMMLMLSAPFSTSSQIAQGLENVIVLRMTPTNPGPEKPVSIFAESFSIDLDTSTISWFINDVLKQQSVGGTAFQFKTGGLGSSTKIDIVAETIGGILETEQIIITPTDIDILWQAHTSAHPLYKGKHIASAGSSISVEVTPHFIRGNGKKLRPDELIYSWRVDNKAVPRLSGRGKNTIAVSQTKPVDSLFIEVEIESADKTLFGRRTLSIPIRESELLVYENNPLLGVLFNKAVGNLHALIGQEVKFITYPFFMSFANRNADYINYSWELNNKPITLGENKSSITVSHGGKEGGSAKISVSVQNSIEIFQRSDTGFSIEFGRGSSSGFGF
jgi:hypothetical protein